MNLLAVLGRCPPLLVLVTAIVATTALFVAVAWGYQRPARLPAPTRPVTPGIAEAHPSSAPSEAAAREAAVAFGTAYFEGGDVLPYLTPAEARTWTRQASASTPTRTPVANVIATSEGRATGGSLGFVVDALIGASEQAVEVFVVEQDDRYLIAAVDP
jgi:hypothetical protein